jgi:hypothetical protein
LIDWISTALSVWAIGGVYLDGWAHSHGKADVSFFTPWHAVMYSGVFALFTFIALHQRQGRLQGFGWLRALPRGYGLTAAGAGLFMVGGALDLAWHTLFGIEINVETVLSPTHLLLATSAVLLVSGPIRAAWARYDPASTRGWGKLGPMVISMALVWAILGFFTQFAHPVNTILADQATALNIEATGANPWELQGGGIAGILLQTALMAAATLLLVKQWRLPFGAITLMITLNTQAMAVFQDRYEYGLAALVTGLLADTALAMPQPSEEQRGRFYLFAAGLPVIFFSLYFLTLHLTRGIGWTIHLWLGAIYMAAAVGLFVSYLLAWPAGPGREAEG